MMVVFPAAALERMPKVSDTMLPLAVVVTPVPAESTMPTKPGLVSVATGGCQVLVTVPVETVGAENTAAL